MNKGIELITRLDVVRPRPRRQVVTGSPVASSPSPILSGQLRQASIISAWQIITEFLLVNFTLILIAAS